MDLKKDLVNKEEVSLETVVHTKKLKNVKVNDKNLLESVLLSKMSKAFIPDEGRLEKINKIAIAPLEQKDVVVLTIKAAGSRIDRGDDQFQTSAHVKMAAKAIENEIPLLLSKAQKDHNWLGFYTLGTVFDAYEKGGELFYEVYVAKTQKNLEDLEMVLAGHYKKVSVGFSMSPADYHCSSCNIPIVSKECPHQPGENGVYCKITDIEDNYEISIVAVPMQSEAQIMRSSMEGKTLENSPTDRINNDTIEDSTLMEDTSKKEETVQAVEAPATTPDPVSLAILEALKSLNTNIQGMTESVKAMDSKLDNLNTKEAPKVEVAEPAAETETKAVSQEPAKVVSSKAANPPIDQRLAKTEIEIEKTLNDLLFERLTLPNE